jgi:hypothetical protein
VERNFGSAQPVALARSNLSDQLGDAIWSENAAAREIRNTDRGAPFHQFCK